MVTAPSESPAPSRRRLTALWNRKLERYPARPARALYLTVTVLATVAIYYELYIVGAVATKVMAAFGYSFAAFVGIIVLSSLGGAAGSLAAGFAGRRSRANLVVGALLVNGLLIAFVVPNLTDRAAFTAAMVVVGVVGGMALVGTSALVRDFSPQSWRGAAMGSWAMGPALASLALAEVTTHTLADHPAWQFQYRLCGIAGLVVGAIALLALRELSPALRDQVVASGRDPAVVEARARMFAAEPQETGLWRAVARPRVLAPAAAIVCFLGSYFVVAGFLVTYLATTFGYTQPRAEALGHWFWIVNAVALVLGGSVSDRLRVRKPFMLAGALVTLVGTALFAAAATDPHAGRNGLIAGLVIMAAGSGVTYACWLASFTETVERDRPAAVLSGLAISGWVTRMMVGGFSALLLIVVNTSATLVDKGPRVQSIVVRYPDQVAVLRSVDAATLNALRRNARDRAAQTGALSQLTGIPRTQVATVLARRAAVLRGARRLKSLSRMPKAALRYVSSYGARTARIVDAHPRQIAVVNRLSASTRSRLLANPQDTAAQMQAVSELSGVPAAIVTAAVDDGTAIQAAGERLRSVSAIPAGDLEELSAYGTRISGILARYPSQVQVIQAAGPATMAGLARSPGSTSLQAQAVSHLTGLPAATVARVITLSVTRKSELATAQALSPATAAALQRNRGDAEAVTAAVREVGARLHLDPSEATARLIALSSVPAADLRLMQSSGPKVQAAAARLKSVQAIPARDLAVLSAHGARIQGIASRYPAQIAVLKTVDAATMQTLRTQPGNVAAQARAVSELTGLPAATVGSVIVHGGEVQAAGDELRSVSTVPAADLAYIGAHGPRLERIQRRYPAQLRVLRAVDARTLRALDRHPEDTLAQARAITQLTGLPKREVRTVVERGPALGKAARRLQALNRMPGADIQYLAVNGAAVATAKAVNPSRWQRWWWICFAGQVVFLPSILLLGGRWSPRRARQDTLEHERRAEREAWDLELGA